jgi:hypothetical protein
MANRSWEPQWEAFLAAQDAHRIAMENLKVTPTGDKESFRAALDSGRKMRDAWNAFGEAFDAEQFGR